MAYIEENYMKIQHGHIALVALVLCLIFPVANAQNQNPAPLNHPDRITIHVEGMDKNLLGYCFDANFNVIRGTDLFSENNRTNITFTDITTYSSTFRTTFSIFDLKASINFWKINGGFVSNQHKRFLDFRMECQDKKASLPITWKQGKNSIPANAIWYLEEIVYGYSAIISLSNIKKEDATKINLKWFSSTTDFSSTARKDNL
jgi:hypothetical protein